MIGIITLWLYRFQLMEEQMKITKRQLRQIIREGLSRLLTEEIVDGDFAAEAAYEAYGDGIKTLGQFVDWIIEFYPRNVQGVSKTQIRKDVAYYWKMEKADRR